MFAQYQLKHFTVSGISVKGSIMNCIDSLSLTGLYQRNGSTKTHLS
jgi:hypothetical protein